jgi:NADH-quinone oxidoreductase subunit M
MLSVLIFLPLIASALVLFSNKDNAGFHRGVALASSLLTFLLSLLIWRAFDSDSYAMQFVENVSWIPALGIHYHLGIDGLSLPLLLMTTVVSLVSAIASASIQVRTREYFFWLLMLQTGILGLFVSLDLFLFYVFWEATLVPMYFLISAWGGERREYAGTKFFLFTLAGGVFMLLGIIALYFASAGISGGARTFDIVALIQLAQSGQMQLAGTAALLIFLGLYVGFAVKVPGFPFHTWLPLTHVETPIPVVILSGVMLKMGAYGILRVIYPIFPEQTKMFLPVLVVIATINIVYGALCAMAQTDLKRMLAYSSIGHMGYCLLGMAAVMGNSNAAHAGLSGAVLQMVNHSFISASLFLLVGVLEDRTGARDINAFGGLAGRVPVFAGLLMLQAFASMGLPGLSGFVSEFLAFLGAFGGTFAHFNFKIPAAIATLGILLTAVYLLSMIKAVLMGEPNAKWESRFTDLKPRELVTIVPLAALTVAVGVYPAFVLNMMDATLTHLIKLVAG